MIGNEILLGALVSLAGALGTVLWFFFAKAWEKLDEIKKCIHDIEIRHADKIDILDEKLEKTNRDLYELFTQFGEMKGFCNAMHLKREGKNP